MEQLEEENNYHVRIREVGYRFRPTDVELLDFFLKRKVVQGRKFDIESITELDIYKHAPWDLRNLTLTRGDFMWYFFCPVAMQKYGGGCRSNRASEFGYWRGSGKDRTIKWKGKSLGVMKTLIFYRGKSPKGERTNWVVHEYKLDDEDSYVICVVFEKDGFGPSKGFQYTTQFNEEGCINYDYDYEIHDQNLVASGSTSASVLDADDVSSPNAVAAAGVSVASMDDKLVPQTGAPQPPSQVQKSFDSFDSVVEYIDECLAEDFEAFLNDGRGNPNSTLILEQKAPHQHALVPQVQESNYYVQSQDDEDHGTYDGNLILGPHQLSMVPQVQESNHYIQSQYDETCYGNLILGQEETLHQLTLVPQVQESNHYDDEDHETCYGNLILGQQESLHQLTLVPQGQESNHYDDEDHETYYGNLILGQEEAPHQLTLVPQVQISNNNFPSLLEFLLAQDDDDEAFINEGQGNYGNFNSIWQPETQYGHYNYGGSSNFIQGNCTF
ncbi:No apical meristem (NAM) protein [Corchorus olitorius]|uniref:No apical meristem (NAM) protein n=1 Tax=Corchorus olitorius TaxID=93759 RepID=A0A1R3HGL5_9ROSI|nr:No apical meristem (NAM) protein [Corchorus olitorius]